MIESAAGQNDDLPRKMMPVARMLVKVVPRLLAKTPPRRGVHVLLRLKADIKRLNSVCEVPNSRERRLFNGPSTYEALRRYL